MHKMRMKNKLLLVLFSVLMMGLLRTGFVFFAVGMLPGIIAYYMDTSAHRYVFKSVFAANLAGMMPYLVKLIAYGPHSALLHEIMGSSSSWFVMYGAAFLGWLLVKLCPLLAQMGVKNMHRIHLQRYQSVQHKLESEWGQEVRQSASEAIMAPSKDKY